MSPLYDKLAATVGLCFLGVVILYLSRTRNLPISQQLRWGRVWLRTLGWACLLVGGFLTGTMIYAGPLLFFLIIIFVVMCKRSSRHTATELWLTIAAGVRNQVPIPSLVEAIVEESGTAPHYHKLLAQLRGGMSLEELVRKLRIGRPEQTALALAAKTGKLDEAIAKTQETRTALRDVEELFAGRLLLLLLVLQFIPVGTFIVPKIYGTFQRILEDFGVTFGIGTDNWAIWLPLESFSPSFLGATWTAVSAITIIGILVYWLGGYGLLRDLWPWAQSSFRSRNLILLNFAQGIRGGLPLPEILDILINSPPSFGIRGRLFYALEAIYRGDDAWEAMRKSRIISREDADILAAAQQLGELPASLETLAEFYRDRYSAALRNWAVVGYLIIVGVVVLGSVILYAFTFGFLLTIISHLL